jgi:hypothetical protein
LRLQLGAKHPVFLANNQFKYDLAVGYASWQYFEAGNRPSTAAMMTFGNTFAF